MEELGALLELSDGASHAGHCEHKYKHDRGGHAEEASSQEDGGGNEHDPDGCQCNMSNGLLPLIADLLRTEILQVLFELANEALLHVMCIGQLQPAQKLAGAIE